MANSIATITKYLATIIEEQYRVGSLTNWLDTTGVITEGLANAKEVKIPKLTLAGLGDYSKTSGYASGDVTLEYVTYALSKDRGRKFSLDAVDNIESAGVALAQLASTFLRDYVIPELDAYRFSQYAAGANTANVVSATLTKANIIESLDAASVALSDAEVPQENRILFVSAAVAALIRQSVDSQRIHSGTVVNRKVTYFDDMQLVEVPSSRFKDKVTLGTNGFTNPSGAVGMNFIMIDKNAPLQIVKHAPARIFSPDQNQNADAWLYAYRCYHDCTIRANKKAGVYVSKLATA